MNYGWNIWMTLCSAIFFLLLTPGSICAAQMVTIRVVNGSDGRPLTKESVLISLLYSKGDAGPPDHVSTVINLQTDGVGEAHYALPEPAPRHLSVRVSLTSAYWRCSCGALVTTEEVIKSGVIGAQGTKEMKIDKQLIKPRPGEIIFTPMPMTLLQRLLYPFLKE
jgi:hypothetical protein